MRYPRRLQARAADKAIRPYVAFTAVDERHARRLYRAQNLIWVWLGLAAVLSGLSYFLRPDLGMALVSKNETIDIIRQLMFAIGGACIALGVWRIRRVFEIVGHIGFACGAVITAAATATLPGPQYVAVATTLGVALASAFRVYFLVRWIEAVGGVH